MRRDDALLLDMLIAARKINRFMHSVTVEQFASDELIQSAVIRELQVIGEAARLIPGATRKAIPEIDWHNIAGMQNWLVHQYFSIRLDVVWKTVRQDIPAPIRQLEQLVPGERE